MTDNTKLVVFSGGIHFSGTLFISQLYKTEPGEGYNYIQYLMVCFVNPFRRSLFTRDAKKLQVFPWCTIPSENNTFV